MSLNNKQIEHCRTLDNFRAAKFESKMFFMAKGKYFKLIGIGKTASILNLETLKTSEISIELANKYLGWK